MITNGLPADNCHQCCQQLQDFGSTEVIATRTKGASPKVAYNPMQFVKTAPPKLVTTAQEQLKKADQIKKIRETNKDEAEEWQAVRIIHLSPPPPPPPPPPPAPSPLPSSGSPAHYTQTHGHGRSCFQHHLAGAEPTTPTTRWRSSFECHLAVAGLTSMKIRI